MAQSELEIAIKRHLNIANRRTGYTQWRKVSDYEKQEHSTLPLTDPELLAVITNSLKVSEYNKRILTVPYSAVLANVFLSMTQFTNHRIFEDGEWKGYRSEARIGTRVQPPLFVTLTSDTKTARLQVYIKPEKAEKRTPDENIKDILACRVIAGKIAKDGGEISYDPEFKGRWSFGIHIEPQVVTWPDRTGRRGVYAELLKMVSQVSDARLSPNAVHPLLPGPGTFDGNENTLSVVK